MAHILIMPRQGNTVESCIIVDWKVNEGDTVQADTTVCDVETDKAAFEVPAGAAGTVLKILHPSGDDVPVLEPIAVIGALGEKWDQEKEIKEGGSLLSADGGQLGVLPEAKLHPIPGVEFAEQTPRQKPTAFVTPAAADAASSATPSAGALPPQRPRWGDTLQPSTSCFGPPGAYATPQRIHAPQQRSGKTPARFAPQTPPAASPRARNLAAKEALPLEGLTGAGPGGRIIEPDIQAALAERPPLTAAAKAAGVAASPPAGTGIGGRVTLSDVASSPHSPLPTPHSPEGQITETPIKGIRKIIAGRMFKSLAETAQFTLNAQAPAERLQEMRARIKESALAAELGIAKITVNDLILFAVSRLLPRYPFMNAHKIDDTIKTFERVHLGLAVDTPRGLMVPVIRNANLLPLAALADEAKRLAAACQNGSAKPDELSGSTFTVSNLGNLGISSFTPVLNTPEVAILGVCGIELKPLADDKAESGVRFAAHIGFSLTINHQVVDGAPAARFLKALGEAVAEIDLLLAVG